MRQPLIPQLTVYPQQVRCGERIVVRYSVPNDTSQDVIAMCDANSPVDQFLIKRKLSGTGTVYISIHLSLSFSI